MDILAGIHYEASSELQEDTCANIPRTIMPTATEKYSVGITSSEHYNNVVQAYATRRENPDNNSDLRMTVPTGCITIKIGDLEGIVAMVDSGAEMNLVTPDLAKVLKKRFAIDETGRKFRMKNASGSITHLQGRFNNILVEIGGRHCNSSFFIGEPWNSEFHVILGQTFMCHYTCSMIWDTTEGEEHMYLHLYPGRQ